MEIIFGRDFKLEAADPYLFYAYEFRRYTLMSKLIVVIGYGFGDTHINKILTQGIRDDINRQLLVVSNCEECDLDKKAQEIATKLDLANSEREQIGIHSGTAKQFLGTGDLANLLLTKIPKSPDAPF
jgi:hypothetical protein